MSAALRQTAEAWLAAGEATCIVEIIEARGSTPRERGTRMLVSAARTAGTIGGGHLEWLATQHAREHLAAGALPATESLALGPSLGQCCGGAVRLSYTALSAESLTHWPVPAPRPRVQMHGAGHVGQAIARILATLDVDLRWVEERDDFIVDTPWPPHWQLATSDDAVGEVHAAAPGTHYLVLTHNHDLDFRITQAILERGDAASVGLIGSHTKSASFRSRLARRGVAEDRIASLRCPMGLPVIADKRPEAIAVAVCAELLAFWSRPPAA